MLKFSFLLAIAPITCGFVLSAAASPDARVQGVVFDQTRKPIANASVAEACLSSGSGERKSSAGDGSFTIGVQDGCALVISAEGFQTVRRTPPFTSAGSGAIEIILPVAPQTETMTVEANVAVLDTAASSTRMPIALQDVPQAITVVTRDLIREQAMMSMADVVRYVPGITMAQGEGHRDAPVIRGNATTADFYVNGVRDDVQYFRDLYNVERVEAVKGANALTFGRGGGGGVINRVTKAPSFGPVQEVSLQGGSFGNKRASADFGGAFREKLAFRANAVYEDSRSFRNGVTLERYGVAPSLTWRIGDATRLTAAYEYFNDGRSVDRGIPSYLGVPAPAHRSTFFGNPKLSVADASVNLGSATLEHHFRGYDLRNTTTVGDYDKFYQNVFPGAVSANMSLVNVSGYNNATARRNTFNQTDVTTIRMTGRFRHTILMGSEFGRQSTANFRETGYFNNRTTSINVPFSDPTDFTPVTFRQAASDADNAPLNRVASTYVQDQVEVSRYLQVVGGIRYDYFNLSVLNNRDGSSLGRIDHMLSPRAGVVVKPAEPVSFYGSYSVSYLPGSGDQFSSLTVTTQALKPEKFTNYEVGAKWDVRRALSLTAAVYRLDRTNTRSVDPNNPALILQTGSQRTNGFEAGVNGQVTRKWTMAGGYSLQEAFISSATAAAPFGAQVALVPRHSVSLWNNYQVRPRWSVGLGLIQQSRMYAGIDNKVVLPSFFRADFATSYRLTEMIRLQANLENIFDRKYFATAHSNNNISPGFARALRIGMIANF